MARYTMLDQLRDIDNNYTGQLNDSTAAQNSANQAALMPFGYNISNAGKTYQPMRNQAYTQQSLGKRALAERMANMGMGLAGGTSQRANNNQNNQFLGNLKNIGLQQQGYVDEQNRGIDQTNAQNQAKIAELTAQNRAARNEAIGARKQELLSQLLAMYLQKRITKANYNKYVRQIGAY